MHLKKFLALIVLMLPLSIIAADQNDDAEWAVATAMTNFVFQTPATSPHLQNQIWTTPKAGAALVNTSSWPTPHSAAAASPTTHHTPVPIPTPSPYPTPTLSRATSASPDTVSRQLITSSAPSPMAAIARPPSNAGIVSSQYATPRATTEHQSKLNATVDAIALRLDQAQQSQKELAALMLANKTAITQTQTELAQHKAELAHQKAELAHQKNGLTALQEQVTRLDTRVELLVDRLPHFEDLNNRLARLEIVPTPIDTPTHQPAQAAASAAASVAVHSALRGKPAAPTYQRGRGRGRGRGGSGRGFSVNMYLNIDSQDKQGNTND